MPIGVYERKSKDPVERIINFVEFEPNTGCWLWTGSCLKNNYGTFSIGPRTNKKDVLAHRFSYETFVEPIPEGMKVLHKCDVRSCVNWEHLFLGTTQNNSSDMALKGRGTKSNKGLPCGVQTTRHGKFSSKVKFGGKYLYLGTFDTAEEAGEVAFKKKLELVNENN